MVAAEMAAAFRRMVDHLRREHQMPPSEALARAEEPASAEYLEGILNRPPEQASWFELKVLMDRDPALALCRWDGIKQTAREELRGKARAGKVMEGLGSDP